MSSEQDPLKNYKKTDELPQEKSLSEVEDFLTTKHRFAFLAQIMLAIIVPIGIQTYDIFLGGLIL